MAENATMTVLSVRICQRRGERGLDRDRRRLLVLDDLAEHVLLLELAARRLPQLEREHRHHRDRDAEQQERPPPAVVATDARRRCRRR